MYQIDIGSLKSMLEATAAFRTALETLSENLETRLTAMDTCWSGTAKETAQATARTLLDKHCAPQITRLTTMEAILTETLKRAILIKDRMRKLEQVLQGEEPAYSEAILANDAEYEGTIGFDETLADTLIWDCADISDRAEELQLLVDEIAGDLEGIVDVSMEQYALSQDCRRLQNLRRYADAYRICGEAMEDVNTYLTENLPQCTAENRWGMTAADTGSLTLTPAADLSRIKTLTEKTPRDRSPEEQRELAQALSCISLDYLYSHGMETEKYEKVKEILEKETWTPEETAFLCKNLNDYAFTKDQEKLKTIVAGLTTEQHEERQTANGPATYYVVTIDPEKSGQLLQGAADNRLPYAYQYALAINGIHLEGLPVGTDPSTDGYEIYPGEWTEGKSSLTVTIHTGVTEGWCQTEVDNAKDHGLFGSAYDRATGAAWQHLSQGWENLKEEWERYIELGLTGYVKYGYHEIIDYPPDEMILLYGKTNTFVSVSSVWEAQLLDGNQDNLDDYILINARSNAKGVSDGIWDNTLGQWESLILAASDLFQKLVIDPRQYVNDTLCGKNPDEGWERGLKVSLSLVQMITGIPVYTSARQTEKDIMQLKEAAAQFMEKMPKTPEEWKNRIEGAVTRTYQEAEAVKEVLEQLAALTPEEWGNILENTLNRLEERAKAYCTEENIEELCYNTGYVEGSVIGILIEELFEAALGLEISEALKPGIIKGADAVDTAGDLAKLDIGDLPDAGDVRKIEDAVEDVVGEAVEEVVEKNLDDVAEAALKGGLDANIHPARIADEALDDDLLKNANVMKDKLPTWAKNKGNFGYSEVDIEGVDNTQFFAHSSIQTEIPSVKDSGISIKPESSPFKTVEVNGSNVINGEAAWPRDIDTEYKILSDIQSKLADNYSASGKIKLYTELEPCPSCQSVIEQFKEMYPNIDIEVIYSIEK